MLYVFCALLGGGVLMAIAVPLFGRRDTLESAIIEETQWDLLQRKKEVTLGNVQDLDFEFKCGKLSESDYRGIRADLMNDAARTLAEIDQLEASMDLDALISREVAARNNSEARKSAACPACGSKNPPTGKFCGECGA
ncbi:MAG TPA: zinc ribbon domain-containing protein, partial [Terriglobia bacterium]|nr:zinc ribbon domain-containing protein [Terriglobia bacterium]